jgi:rubredoxin
MPVENKWIEIPLLLNYEDFINIEKHFTHLGIHFRSKTVITSIGPEGAEHAYSIFVPMAHAKAAALAFRHFMNITDPGSGQPFSGNCPACGEQINNAWVCPSCEISFSGGYKEDDPIVIFIKQFGGFDDS